MPTYDYRCEACGHEMALFQGIKEDPIKTCPKCEEDKLRRLIGSGAGIIFKGSGFYETDYKRARPSSKSPGSSDEGGSDSKKSERKSDTKKSDSKETSD